MSPALKQIIDEASPGILAQVRTEGRVETLLRQLERKFGALDAITVQRLRAADDTQLNQIADSILDARTLEDVLVQQ